MEARIGSSVGEPCALHFSLAYKAWETHLYYPSAFFLHHSWGFTRVCAELSCFPASPRYPAVVQMKYELLLSCIWLLPLQHSWDSNQPALAVFYIPHLHGSTAGEGCSPLYHLYQSITAWASTSLRAIRLNCCDWEPQTQHMKWASLLNL